MILTGALILTYNPLDPRCEFFQVTQSMAGSESHHPVVIHCKAIMKKVVVFPSENYCDLYIDSILQFAGFFKYVTLSSLM